MKMVLSIALLVTLPFVLPAQSMEDLKKAFYYQRYQQAEALWQSLYQRFPEAGESWYWKAQLYLRQGQTDAARKWLLTSPVTPDVAGNRKHALLLTAWAQVLLETGQADEANELLEQILAATRFKNPDVLLAAVRAQAASARGDWNRALSWLERAPEKITRTAGAYLLAGDLYRRLGEGGKAVRAYDDAFLADPGCAEAMYKTGLIYKSQQNTEIYLEKFQEAYRADSTYAPALFQLYSHYFSRDVNKAADFLYSYIRHSDPSESHAYLEMDLQYISGKTDDALQTARLILEREGEAVQPRLHKLIAYCTAAQGDSATALRHLHNYFSRQPDSLLVAKDYVLKLQLQQYVRADTADIISSYRRAIALEENAEDKVSYMKSLADLQRERGNRAKEARWREAIVQAKQKPGNLDIYNWGLALFYNRDYDRADSVFALYEERYPDQVHGYLWRARCNALIDSTMERGMAVPHYLKLIEVAHQDTARNRDLLLRAYGYLGVYEANISKQYRASLGYFTKVLDLDPGNQEAITNVAVLQQMINKETSGSDMN